MPQRLTSNARRIVAYGLRNPFRFTLRPGTDELWIADVGWHTYEEIDRLTVGATAANLGWPCYEGPARQPRFDALDLKACEDLYAREARADLPGLQLRPWTRRGRILRERGLGVEWYRLL